VDNFKKEQHENLLNVISSVLVNICSKKTPQIESNCLLVNYLYLDNLYLKDVSEIIFIKQILKNSLKLLESEKEFTLTLIGNILQNVIAERVNLLKLIVNKQFICELVKNIKVFIFKIIFIVVN